MQRVEAGGAVVLGSSGHGKSSIINKVVDAFAAVPRQLLEEEEGEGGPAAPDEPPPSATVAAPALVSLLQHGEAAHEEEEEEEHAAAARERIAAQVEAVTRKRGSAESDAVKYLLWKDNKPYKFTVVAKMRGMLSSGNILSSSTTLAVIIRNSWAPSGSPSLVATFKTEEALDRILRKAGRGADADAGAGGGGWGSWLGKTVGVDLSGLAGGIPDVRLRGLFDGCNGMDEGADERSAVRARSESLDCCVIHKPLNLACSAIKDTIGEGEANKLLVTGRRSNPGGVKAVARFMVTKHKTAACAQEGEEEEEDEDEDGEKAAASAWLINFLATKAFEYKACGPAAHHADQDCWDSLRKFATRAKAEWEDCVMVDPILMGATLALIREERVGAEQAALVHTALYIANAGGLHEVLHATPAEGAARVLKDSLIALERGIGAAAAEDADELSVEGVAAEPGAGVDGACRVLQLVARLHANENANRAFVDKVGARPLLGDGKATHVLRDLRLKENTVRVLEQFEGKARALGFSTLSKLLKAAAKEGAEEDSEHGGGEEEGEEEAAASSSRQIARKLVRAVFEDLAASPAKPFVKILNGVAVGAKEGRARYLGSWRRCSRSAAAWPCPLTRTRACGRRRRARRRRRPTRWPCSSGWGTSWSARR